MNHLAPWSLLKPNPNVCQVCAVDHAPELPHNAQSLHYQYQFYDEHGRWPKWRDAMAHCSEEMKAHWIRELSAKGVKMEELV